MLTIMSLGYIWTYCCVIIHVSVYFMVKSIWVRILVYLVSTNIGRHFNHFWSQLYLDLRGFISRIVSWNTIKYGVSFH